MDELGTVAELLEVVEEAVRERGPGILDEIYLIEGDEDREDLFIAENQDILVAARELASGRSPESVAGQLV